MEYASEIEEYTINVHNVFVIKHIMDDPGVRDGLLLIGTFVQHAFCGKPNASESDSDDKPNEKVDTSGLNTDNTQGVQFGYRFNDQTADERSGAVDLRRTEKHWTPDLGDCYRHTFQIKAPLELEIEFNAFPFKVVTANLLIELSTTTTPNGLTRLRPDLLLHKKDKRNMCSIQKAYAKKESSRRLSVTSMMDPSENLGLLVQAKEKIDKSYVYDFASPFPTVTYFYDPGKKYCPKYSVSFMLVEDGMKKFIEIVFPMILIAAMNHLNVINSVWAVQGRTDEVVEAVSYINNSATLALAVVVFLPTMFGRSRFHEVFTANNFYITTIFIALVLSAFPHGLIGTNWPSRLGAYLFWGSFLFPVTNGFRFVYYVRSQRKSIRPEFFMDDAVSRIPSRRFKLKDKQPVLGEFICIKDLLELGDFSGMEYKHATRGKFDVVEYENDSEGVRLHSLN
ncbi:MAG: hypothetical protein SGBAC_000818 [Bacillariaceae sp.]